MKKFNSIKDPGKQSGHLPVFGEPDFSLHCWIVQL